MSWNLKKLKIEKVLECYNSCYFSKLYRILRSTSKFEFYPIFFLIKSKFPKFWKIQPIYPKFFKIGTLYNFENFNSMTRNFVYLISYCMLFCKYLTFSHNLIKYDKIM